MHKIASDKQQFARDRGQWLDWISVIEDEKLSSNERYQKLKEFDQLLQQRITLLPKKCRERAELGQQRQQLMLAMNRIRVQTGKDLRLVEHDLAYHFVAAARVALPKDQFRNLWGDAMRRKAAEAQYVGARLRQGLLLPDQIEAAE